MNSEKVILFIILLLGLIIVFSFLGERNSLYESFTGSFSGKFMTSDTSNDIIDSSGNILKNPYHRHDYDNYNHFSGSSSSLTNGTMFYGPNGGSIVVNTQVDGTQILKVKMTSDCSPVTFTTKTFSNKFFGPKDEVAFVIYNNDQMTIKIVSSSGTSVFTTSESQTNNQTKNLMNNHNQINKNYTKYNNTPNTYYGSTGDIYSASSFANNAYTGPDKPMYNDSRLANNSKGTYNSSLPPGIPKSQIPPGQEDLYILKSEIVPPVCPVCPAYPVYSINNSSNQQQQQKCPPCPACARCPEPSFECKKVPNYNAIDNNYLPVPVLNDFSTFGM
jgi:hypothetical protein